MEFDLRIREHDETNILIKDFPYYKVIYVYRSIFSIINNKVVEYLRKFIKPKPTDIGLPSSSPVINSVTSTSGKAKMSVTAETAISEHTTTGATKTDFSVASSDFMLVRKLQTEAKPTDFSVASNKPEASEKTVASPKHVYFSAVSSEILPEQYKLLKVDERIGVSDGHYGLSEMTGISAAKTYIGVSDCALNITTGHYRTLAEVDEFGTLASLDDMTLDDIDYEIY